MASVTRAPTARNGFLGPSRFGTAFAMAGVLERRAVQITRLSAVRSQVRQICMALSRKCSACRELLLARSLDGQPTGTETLKCELE
jgi:hypothetical protein